jgi:phospholipid-translocating ATPase
MFNTLFTSLIVIMLGIFEQDLRASTLIAVPELYTKGQRSLGFNLRVYLGWMVMGFVDAAIIFFSMIFLYAQSDELQSAGMFPIGDMTFTACVILIAVKLQLIEQRYISLMACIAVVLSVGGWFMFNILLAALYQKNNEYGVRNAFFTGFGRQGLWWVVVIFSTSTCILFELAVRALKNAFFPTDVETFQALEKDLDVRKRFEEASAPWMQAGWDHGTKRSSLELRHDAAEQAKREREVQELLNRPRVMEEGGVLHMAPPLVRLETEETPVLVRDGSGTNIQDVLARRHGSVQEERLTRP